VTALAVSGPHRALALEALEVTLDPAHGRQILALVDAELATKHRLERLAEASAGAPDGSGPQGLTDLLREIVADPRDDWRSAWVTACAMYTAQARGTWDLLDTRRAQALDDPAIDELLALAGSLHPSVP
jgi:hypothetical protein